MTQRRQHKHETASYESPVIRMGIYVSFASLGVLMTLVLLVGLTLAREHPAFGQSAILAASKILVLAVFILVETLALSIGFVMLARGMAWRFTYMMFHAVLVIGIAFWWLAAIYGLL